MPTRIIVGVIVAPLIWLFFGHATEFAFALLSSGSFFMRWSLSANIDIGMVGVGYLAMITTCFPFSLVCRALQWQWLWVYAVAGAGLGFVVPVYLTFIVEYILGDSSQAQVFGIPPLFIPQMWHFQTGAAIVTTLMFVIYWLIAVHRNAWYRQRPNKALQLTATSGG